MARKTWEESRHDQKQYQSAHPETRSSHRITFLSVSTDQALTDPQLFRIIDAFLIRVEDLFPARRRFVKLSRDRRERVARLNNIGSAARFPGSSFLWKWTARLRLIRRAPHLQRTVFQFLAQIEVFISQSGGLRSSHHRIAR